MAGDGREAIIKGAGAVSLPVPEQVRRLVPSEFEVEMLLEKGMIDPTLCIIEIRGFKIRHCDTTFREDYHTMTDGDLLERLVKPMVFALRPSFPFHRFLEDVQCALPAPATAYSNGD